MTGRANRLEMMERGVREGRGASFVVYRKKKKESRLTNMQARFDVSSDIKLHRIFCFRGEICNQHYCVDFITTPPPPTPH